MPHSKNDSDFVGVYDFLLMVYSILLVNFRNILPLHALQCIPRTNLMQPGLTQNMKNGQFHTF